MRVRGYRGHYKGGGVQEALNRGWRGTEGYYSEGGGDRGALPYKSRGRGHYHARVQVTMMIQTL